MGAVRLVLAVLFRLLFRVEVHGAEHLAAAGDGRRVIAINHVSHLDPLVVFALLDLGDALHVLAPESAAKPYVRWLLRFADRFRRAPSTAGAAMRLVHEVEAGRSVVVFPEGRVTVTGSLMKVYDSAGLLADEAAAEVVPVRIAGLELTPFSRLTSDQVKKRLFPKVTVTVLPPRRLDVNPALVGKARRAAAGKALYLTMSDLHFRTADTDQTLFAALRQAADRFGAGQPAVKDAVGGDLTYKTLMIGALVLGRKLAPLSQPGEAVGVLLPNAAGVAATIFALSATGRVPAMLNYTAGPANIRSACRAAQVKTVLTSRAFVERAQLQPLIDGVAGAVELVWLEDIRKTIGTTDKLRGLIDLMTWRAHGAADDPAIILFTSGSEGTPKGVVLSHRNILANCAQVAARIEFGPEDMLFNVLPVFHSFGLTGGLMLPLLYGVKLYLYPSPLHYKQVPEQIYATGATIFFATDTFLTGYARAADPYDFRSIRLILAGAEPVRAETRRVYMEKFGLRILEGFGLTEATPVAAVNTPMYNKNGSVGLVLPGVDVRLEPVPGIEDAGRLWLRGPNIMRGYLRPEAPGVLEPPPNGWHDSGDVVSIDSDGFMFIRGRVKRFAKIAGEMVSLAAVEALVSELWPEEQHAVVAVSDPRRGERVVLLTTRQEPSRGELIAHAKAKGASELMLPADLIFVETMPVLGSGKTDHVSARKVVLEKLGRAA